MIRCLTPYFDKQDPAAHISLNTSNLSEIVLLAGMSSVTEEPGEPIQRTDCLFSRKSWHAPAIEQGSRPDLHTSDRRNSACSVEKQDNQKHVRSRNATGLKHFDADRWKPVAQLHFKRQVVEHCRQLKFARPGPQTVLSKLGNGNLTLA